MGDGRRPYRTGSHLIAGFPTLKRGANKHCASGARNGEFALWKV